MNSIIEMLKVLKTMTLEERKAFYSENPELTDHDVCGIEALLFVMEHYDESEVQRYI